jgi:TonB family protein
LRSLIVRRRPKLFLDDGQTIVIAGLIKQNRSESVNRVPFLSKIPIAGMLFRKKSSPSADLDQELVITITPKIYKDTSNAKPTEEKKAPAPVTEEAPVVSPAAAETADDALTPVTLDDVKEEDARDEALKMAEENMTDETKSEETVPAEGTDSDLIETPGAEAETPASPEADLSGELETEGLEGDELAKAAGDVSAPAAPAEDIGEAQEKAIAAYVQSVQKMIAEAISFPYEAREKGWEGTVTLALTILSDGTLQDVDIRKSSGHDVFDNDAKNTAQILSPFDPFPPELDLEEIVVSLPIVYSQKMLTQ